MQGGGGPLLTGTIGESKAYNCHCEQRERTEAQSENVKQNCHAELVSASGQRCGLSVSPDRSRNKFGMTPAEPTAEWHPQLVEHDFLTPNQLGSRLDRRWIATLPVVARNDVGRLARLAFTMAEILLSLTIIGVVAAITLPSLTGNINERTWNTQRKALYARMSQAIALMPNLNGYGTLAEDDSGSVTADTAAETFVTAGLAKVLKINNICDNEHFKDCGLPKTITRLSGEADFNFPTTMAALNTQMVLASSSYDSTYSYSAIRSKAVAFETANGESIAVYYNKNCVADLKSSEAHVPIQTMVCANFVYDLNGLKGPNTVGKDIGFMTAFYPTDSVLAAPYVKRENAVHENGWIDAAKYCTAQDNKYRLPTTEEAGAIFVNKRMQSRDHFIGTGNGSIWTSSLGYTTSGTKAWAQNISSGARMLVSRNNRYSSRCVER